MRNVLNQLNHFADGDSEEENFYESSRFTESQYSGFHGE